MTMANRNKLSEIIPQMVDAALETKTYCADRYIAAIWTLFFPENIFIISTIKTTPSTINRLISRFFYKMGENFYEMEKQNRRRMLYR